MSDEVKDGIFNSVRCPGQAIPLLPNSPLVAIAEPQSLAMISPALLNDSILHSVSSSRSLILSSLASRSISSCPWRGDAEPPAPPPHPPLPSSPASSNLLLNSALAHPSSKAASASLILISSRGLVGTSTPWLTESRAPPRRGPRVVSSSPHELKWVEQSGQREGSVWTAIDLVGG